MNRDELALLLGEHNQEHLLSYYDKLSQEGKESLAAQIEGVNWEFFQLTLPGSYLLSMDMFCRI